MSKRFARSVVVAALGAAAVLVGVPAATATAAPTPATPVPPAAPRILAHFDFAAGQTPENIAIAPDGSAIVSLAEANQVVRVSRDGTVRVLGQFPTAGRCNVFFPGAAILGLARAHDGTIYVVECSGTAATGVWAIRPGAAPVQIAALRPDAVPNGMALDERTGSLYVADSVLGVVWRVPARGGTPDVWVSDPTLQRVSFGGANGLTIHRGAVFVGNTDKGIVVRIPIRADGGAGPVRTVATGLAGIDDFSVIGRDDTVVAAMIFKNEVVEVKPGQQPRVLLTAADGVSNPTSVRFHGHTMYVSSAAYVTGVDPNLLVTRLPR